MPIVYHPVVMGNAEGLGLPRQLVLVKLKILVEISGGQYSSNRNRGKQGSRELPTIP
jgi:hypothetical protein